MQDETRQADALTHYVDQRQAGRATAPTSEAESVAADLHDLARSLEPDAAFLARLDARLKTPAPALNGHVEVEKENPMTLALRPAPRLRPVASPFLLVATLALLVILVGLVLPFRTPQPPPNAVAPNPLETPLQTTDTPLEYGGFLTDFRPATLDRLRAAGVTWLSVILPVNTSYDQNGNSGLWAGSTQHGLLVALAQSLISVAQGAGFKIAITVAGGPEDTAVLGLMDNPPAGFERGRSLPFALAQLTGTIASLGPDAIQIWQEPNLDRNWRTGQIDPATYVLHLLRPSYEAIKAANPNVLVIAAAPAPTDAQSAFPGQIVNDDVYYQGMAEAGVAEYADCIGMSYNQGAVPPDQTSGDPRGESPLRYLPTMLERAYAPFRETGLPLCITNLVYLSAEGLAEPMSIPFSWANDTSAAEQAQWTVDAITWLETQTIAPVRLVLLAPMNALDDDPLSQTQAIVRPDGTCPTCDLLASRTQPADAAQLLDWCVTYVRRGDSDQAAAYCQQAIDLQPEAGLLARVHLQAGMIEYGRRNYAGAIENFTRCEALGSTDVQCFYLRGLAYYFLVQPDNGYCELAWDYLNRASVMVQASTVDEHTRSTVEEGLRLVSQSCPPSSNAAVTTATVAP
jgi:hypothetical protein